jgi:hypothetical protein
LRQAEQQRGDQTGQGGEGKDTPIQSNLTAMRQGEINGIVEQPQEQP